MAQPETWTTRATNQQRCFPGTHSAAVQRLALPDGDRPGFWYSHDRLLPGIRLSERYADFEMLGRARYYFYVHRLAGYILVLFELAGLTGLTEPTGS